MAREPFAREVLFMGAELGANKETLKEETRMIRYIIVLSVNMISAKSAISSMGIAHMVMHCKGCSLGRFSKYMGLTTRYGAATRWMTEKIAQKNISQTIVRLYSTARHAILQFAQSAMKHSRSIEDI